MKNFSFSSLSSWYNQPLNLELANNNNYITFHFTGITTNRPKEVRYQYFLEGLDESWSTITDRPEASYNNLPPGKYNFKVKAANSEGYWSNELNYPLIILPPWWNTWWAYASYMLVSLLALTVFIRRRERILKREKVLLEEKVNTRTYELLQEKEKVESTLAQVNELQGQLVETGKMNERLRISQELHDDLGGTLSGIVLYSHLAENQVHAQRTGDAEQSLSLIKQSANDMVSRLSDLVWSVNPEHNSIKKVVEKLREYATEMGLTKNIKVRVDAPGILTELHLPVEITHGVYLFFKEAINNAVKYSGATFLSLSVHHSDHSIEVIISDNGNGFDAATVKKGNGLINMQKRAAGIHAKFCLESIPQKGTVISLQCSLQ